MDSKKYPIESKQDTESSQITDHAARQLQALYGHTCRAEKRDRQRFSRVLQEQIQQCIFAARTHLSCMTSARRSNRQIKTKMRLAVSALDQAQALLRELTSDLFPPVLYDAGLIAGLEWLADRMRDKDLTVELSIDETAEPIAEDIHHLLFDGARELLSNVAEHAGVSRARLVLARTDDRKITLTVSDAGKGFDPELLDYIGAHKTGFGLLSVRQRLAQIGGEMRISSGREGGSCVTLVVPGNWCTMLICDDHAIMRAGYLRLMQSDREVAIIGQAADGEQAIKLASELSPDIVIMDVSFGAGINGIDVTCRILAENPGMQVIGVSMHENEAIAEAMRQAGAVEYLLKSEMPEKLLSVINDCRQRLLNQAKFGRRYWRRN